MLKNAHNNQLLVVYQNKAINISISKWKARLDIYTCFISLHAGRPAQQENFKTSWSFDLKLMLRKDSEQNQCKNKSFSGAVCFFLTGFRWEILNLTSILKYHCIFLDLSVFHPKVSYFATDGKQHHGPTVSNRYSQEGWNNNLTASGLSTNQTISAVWSSSKGST